MALEAKFLNGSIEITVHGLTQWDYGQTLEIHDDSLPAMVEVHFAAPGMLEAVVRSCAVVDGVASAVIPDKCLEQNATIKAWVYEVGEASGETVRTITMPISARTKPASSATVPSQVSNKYTEAIAGMNAQIEEMERVADECIDRLQNTFASPTSHGANNPLPETGYYYLRVKSNLDYIQDFGVIYWESGTIVYTPMSGGYSSRYLRITAYGIVRMYFINSDGDATEIQIAKLYVSRLPGALPVAEGVSF